MLTCLLRLSLVFNLNRLINKSLSVSCLDNLRLALACCCLLEVDLMCMNFNLFPGFFFEDFYLLLKYNVLPSLTTNTT